MELFHVKLLCPELQIGSELKCYPVKTANFFHKIENASQPITRNVITSYLHSKTFAQCNFLFYKPLIHKLGLISSIHYTTGLSNLTRARLPL